MPVLMEVTSELFFDMTPDDIATQCQIIVAKELSCHFGGCQWSRVDQDDIVPVFKEWGHKLPSKSSFDEFGILIELRYADYCRTIQGSLQARLDRIRAEVEKIATRDTNMPVMVRLATTLGDKSFWSATTGEALPARAK